MQLKKISFNVINLTQLFFVTLLMLQLAGCTSFGKGVVQALLEKSEEQDTRVCQIRGKAFDGLQTSLLNKQKKTKVLMIHGVGDHTPGYATQFLEKLARDLSLDSRSGNYKEIQLRSANSDNLGSLRIAHLFNAEDGRELYFYELTWSEITREEKALLAFDNSGDYSFRRAKINNMLKTFTNDTGPDPIIYLGKSQELILAAFSQSFCWMLISDWDNLPENGEHICLGVSETNIEHLQQDEYVFVSHSLGSRITIDGLQRIARLLANPETFIRSGEKLIQKRQSRELITKAGKKVTLSNKAIDALRQKRIKIFMLSNQLPMLQLGRELPEITGQQANYCTPDAPNYAERMLSETEIIAFSDPNDLLSYAIPPGFSEKYLDSRLCPSVTNININIAHVADLFGISDLANPLEAHVGYDSDDRVVALIAKGLGNEHSAELIKERCEWTKITE